MPFKKFSSGSGKITNISFSSYSATVNPTDESAVTSGGLLCGQFVSYNPNLPAAFRYNYLMSKGFLAFNTSNLIGYINSGYKIFSAAIFVMPAAVFQDIPWSLNVRTVDTHSIVYESGWEKLQTDDNAADYVSEAVLDWNTSCPTLAKNYSISGWIANIMQKLPIPLYWVTTSGLSEYKLSSNRSDAQDNSGWQLTTTYREYVDIYGFDNADTTRRPYMIIGLAGMKYLRLTDLSIIHYIKNSIDNNTLTSGIVTVSDGYPKDYTNLSIPSIAVEHNSSDVVPLEIAGDNVNMVWEREFTIDIFGATKGQMYDIAEQVYELLDETTPLYDYNTGFPIYGYSPNRIGTIEFDNVDVAELNEIQGFPSTKYHTVILLTARTKVLKPNLNLFNVRVNTLE